jgi:hypothetical protein
VHHRSKRFDIILYFLLHKSMSQAFHRVRSMDAPMGYDDMRAVFFWSGRSLIDSYGDLPRGRLPDYYRYAGEFIARVLDRLDEIEQESPTAVITSIGALSAAVRFDMRQAHGDPYIEPALPAITAQEGANLARGQIASAYLAYRGYLQS